MGTFVVKSGDLEVMICLDVVFQSLALCHNFHWGIPIFSWIIPGCATIDDTVNLSGLSLQYEWLHSVTAVSDI